MRNALSAAMVELAARPDFVFLTGDLGYMALEPLQHAAGDRFINAGVAEQNMVSVAAGLAKSGLRPWVYSIAPFVYARPLEQIRNDVCHHALPVYLIGNGGGYAYGVMGASHHALEDYGIMLTLPGMTVFVPAFREDVIAMRDRIVEAARPAYLRLGRDERPAEMKVPDYAPWRRLLSGQGATLCVVGPLVGGILAAVRDLPDVTRPTVWVVTELPIQAASLPPAFLDDLRASAHLFVVEEHVVAGGAGQMLAHALLCAGLGPRRFTHRYARGYPSRLYGAQAFHRRDCGLDPESIAADLTRPAA